MKMFAIKSAEGKFLRKSKFKADEYFDNAWDATLFRRKCDATNSMNSGRKNCSVVQLEVRVKEDHSS